MKLVRDKLPNLLKERGITFRKGKEGERYYLLRTKLLEEVAELYAAAADKDQILKELADIYEALMAIGYAHDIPPMAIITQAVEKNKARGGFDDLMVMEIDEGKVIPDPTAKPAGPNYDHLGDGRWYSG